MTDYAFEIGEFVLCKLLVSVYNLLVAGLTRNIYVFAIQFEPGFIMVKFFDGPGIVSMTFGAIRYPVFFKLFVVRILMTGNACRM